MDQELDDFFSVLRDEEQLLPIEELSVLSDLDPRQLDRFSGCWQSLSSMRRRTLLATLGQQADEHIELLFDNINCLALDDPDPVIKKIAIGNLWESTDPSLVKPFLTVLSEDNSIEVRAAAAGALGPFVLFNELEDISVEESTLIVDTLLLIIGAGAPPLLQRACVESLGFSFHDDAHASIADAYNSGDDGLMQSSLLAMGRSANPVWRPEILQELIHPSPRIRTEAARAAGELELHDAAQLLIELLEDVSDEVISAAIWSLGQIGGDAAKTALLEIQASAPYSETAKKADEAIEHLAFLEGTPDLLIFDFDDPSEDPVG
ncbi:MAG: HEAT repeat domain-containing protein [Anaerolineales bacterium]|nr:HEAT repeat domain-containing protein [Anaerolineales bacterium]